MKPVIAIAMMHDEEDVAPYVVRHMLDECDAVIVADHASTDGTREILDGIGDPRLTVISIVGAYRQAERMNGLAERAFALRAEWIVPFDADEWWYSPNGRIADVLRLQRSVVTIARTWQLVPQPDDDPNDPNPFTRLRFRRPTPDYQKVAFRPQRGRVLTAGNHRLLDGPVGRLGPLAVNHAPYRSLEHFMRKVRHGKLALEASGANPREGWHWQTLGAQSDEELAHWWQAWTDRCATTF